jgi:glycosyltransferase involved in cell wall biosynthesis
MAQRILSLSPIEPQRAAAAEADWPVVHRATEAELWAALAAADLVIVHYWQHAHLAAQLEKVWPATRVLIWAHVSGLYAPQYIGPELVEWADCFVGCSPVVVERLALLDLPAGLAAKLHTIWATTDFARLENVVPLAHSNFQIGYLGTIGPSKLHPDFVALCARLDLPDVCFPVYGEGNLAHLKQQARAAQILDRMIWGGYVEDPGPSLASFEIMGYPLCAQTSAAAELVLQEAMYLGVPIVLLKEDGLQHNVIPGETGLVARTGDEYIAALRYLYHHPDERLRLGRAAAAYARAHWGVARTAAQFSTLIDGLLTTPKRQRPPIAALRRATPVPPLLRQAVPAAVRLAENVADVAPWLLENLTTTDATTRLATDDQIAASSPVMVHSDGGILHYAYVHPQDRALIRWAALVLIEAGRPALAAAQLACAAALSPDDWTLQWHLARAAHQAHAPQRAQAALARVLAAAPDFRPAQVLRDALAGAP